MGKLFSPELEYSIKRIAARSRFELEAELSRETGFIGQIGTHIHHLVGSIALALFSAGVAIFLVSVILNLIFHYSPT